MAVIPDTQNYVDFRHQKSAGFPVDGGVMFLDQLRYVRSRAVGLGGDVAFVTSLGDVWQTRVDLGPGQGMASPPPSSYSVEPATEVGRAEIPLARRGYELLSGVVPFAVVPGNHDFDWQWRDGEKRRVGGLVSFVHAFGSRTSYFEGRTWYVGDNDGGADSAQVFDAGGYRFLHLALRFQPPDSSLSWAQAVIRRYPGMPTIVTTHDFLQPDGRREGPDDDPETNTPSEVWDKIIRGNDQIFLVLSGHHCGQGYAVDRNLQGDDVHQILADYQCRGQALKDAGMSDRSTGLGDGWLRLMRFNLTRATPTIQVRTYSTHYRRFSTEIPQYAAWYKASERPEMSDDGFLARDDFTIALDDFRKRFGLPSPPTSGRKGR